MFLNYLIVALRNLRKQPGFTAIKVLSLSLGLICSILVLMHVQYTNSYDKHFDNHENIYRVVTSLTSTSGQRIDASLIAEGIFNPLLQDYGQIEEAANLAIPVEREPEGSTVRKGFTSAERLLEPRDGRR